MATKILLFDNRFPRRAPVRLTVDDGIAGYAVRSGWAAAADPAAAGALATGAAVDGSTPTTCLLQHGVANQQLALVVLPLAVAQYAATLGLIAGTIAAAAQPPGYDVIALLGQSNMVGRNGPVDATLDATDARILQYGFDAQTVTLASDPLDNMDETANTVGMGLSIAKAYIAAGLLAPNRQILLVPAAHGNTGFGDGGWRPGGTYFTSAKARINAAMTKGTGTNSLIMFNWHQGEFDQVDTQAQYEADLDQIIANLRASVTGATATTPFIVGGLLVGGAQTGAGVTAALSATPTRTSRTAYAASTGLTGGADNIHFTAASQRTFGGRYFAGYQAALANTVAARAPAAPIFSLVPSSGQVIVALTAVSNGNSPVTGYNIKRSTTSGAEVTIASNVALPYADTTVTNGTKYYYTITALNAVGESVVSAELFVTPGVVNMLSAPNAFDNTTSYTQTNVTVSADQAANPVGGATNADRITQVTDGSTATTKTLALRSGQSGTLVAGQVYTLALDVKAETLNFLQATPASGILATNAAANFNIATGATANTPASGTSAVLSLGGGWYRCSFTFTANTSGNFTANINLTEAANTGRNTGEVAATAKSALFANAQLVSGSTANAF